MKDLNHTQSQFLERVIDYIDNKNPTDPFLRVPHKGSSNYSRLKVILESGRYVNHMAKYINENSTKWQEVMEDYPDGPSPYK